MGKEAKYFLGFIGIVAFVYTKAQNVTLPPPPPPVVTLAPYCKDSDGKIRQIGDVWKPSPLSTCTCVGPQQVACPITLPPLTFKPIVLPCFDSQKNERKQGEVWLDDPLTNCTCAENNFVTCVRLAEPVCLDARGKFRKHMETWLNDSCVECTCVNGSIKCTGYNVNITYGLYKVDVFPTCEQCDIPSRTALTISSCKAFRDNKASLFKCFHGGFYIWDIHRCNGIDECPDGSDEKGCGNVVCKDGEGGEFLIKDENGWNVSKCLSCYCNGGQTTCIKTLSINFPGYFRGVYTHEENCTQPSCKVLKFIRENREWCEGAELIKDRGIIFEGKTWKYGGCSFHFPGSRSSESCPVMTRPVCYVFNGRICCASECSALQQMSDQMRGNLTFCPKGRQLETESSRCREANNCLQNFYIQNCSSAITCQDEDSNQYFEGATWNVGTCMQCACAGGKIQCSRTLVFVSFLQLIAIPQNQPASEQKLTEHCNQPNCNVARFLKTNKGVCNACRWNGKLYYDGDHWKENGVDFYCSSSDRKVRPGCYIENRRVKCTGAIPGIRELSLISKDGLFLCDSGDEIRSLSDRCNIQTTCNDDSDERNCDKYFCPYEISHGFLWNRTQVGGQVLKQCSLVDPAWTGTFGSNCTQNPAKTVWLHNTTCYCEKKTLVDYFKKKIAGVNESNFMNVSNELASSAEVKEFTNPRVFHDLYKELFYIVTSQLLTPLTHQNADTALKYCKNFISTILGSPAYLNPAFCKAKLAYDRNFLAHKALKFLRQAPNDTAAYNVGSSLQLQYVEDEKEKFPYVRPNFKKPAPTFVIQRSELILQINTAPLLQAVDEKPTIKIIHVQNNVTRKNDTNSNDTKITQNNVANELTNKQIMELLKKNNCTVVTFDEEKGVFIYNADVSKEDPKHEKIQSNMELVLLCISIAAVVIALILLTVLRLKNSERIFIHKSLLFSLGVSNLVFVLDTTLFTRRQEHAALCSTVTVLQHFFHTAIFTWMLVEGINLYIKLVKVFSVKKQYAAYIAVGWGIPAVIVGLVAAIRPSTFDMSEVETTNVTCGSLKLAPRIERTRCWINGSLWIYKGPILVILVVNLVLFAILLRVIFGKIASKYGTNHLTAAKRGLRSIIALLPLLGVTLLLGFFLDFHYAIEYLFILLNSTQGVVFCIFHCVLDDQVQDALRKIRVKLKSQSTSKTQETPASHPNTTPVTERSSKVNILHQSVDESSTIAKDVVLNKESLPYDETRL